MSLDEFLPNAGLSPHPRAGGVRKKHKKKAKVLRIWTEEEKQEAHNRLKLYLLSKKLYFSRLGNDAEVRDLQDYLDYLRSLE